MRRALILLVLMTLVVWLAHASPATNTPQPGNGAVALNSAGPNAPAPQDSCCANPGETDPHWECFNYTCMEFNTCGVSVDCNTCGCDPFEELVCISNGGDWDPNTCTCTYGCDPGGYNEAYCWQIGGTWDPFSCICYPPQCNPGPPQISYSQSWWDSYCDGYQIWNCDNTCYHYVQYCQDGSIYNQWNECTNVCSPGGSCGPGGGGDGCWGSGSHCDCDEWGCCDDDGCYDWEEILN